MRKNRIKSLYTVLSLLILVLCIIWTYKTSKTSSGVISYIVDLVIIILLLIVLFRMNGRTKKAVDHNNYTEWITDGNVESSSKLSVGIKSLEDLVKLARDLETRVIHDARLGKYFVLTQDMTYIHDPGMSSTLDNKPQLGKILLERGLLQPQQLETGLYYQKRIGSKLGESLIALGFIDETILYSTLAAQQNISYYELDTKSEITDTSWLANMSLNKARILQALPIGTRVDGKMVVACGETAKAGITLALKEALGTDIYVVAARPSHIYEILDRIEKQEMEKNGFGQLLQEHKTEAYERLDDKEWETFMSEYNNGKIDIALFIKATGLIDDFQYATIPSSEYSIGWLTGKSLINGQVASLITTLDHIIANQDKESRQNGSIPELIVLLQKAYYLSEEGAKWIVTEHLKTGLPMRKLLECNYMVAAETIEYAEMVLETLRSLLSKAKVY